jgi:hypothetical protein
MSSKEFTAKVFKWLYQINCDADLLPVDVKVAVQLTWHFREADEGRARISGLPLYCRRYQGFGAHGDPFRAALAQARVPAHRVGAPRSRSSQSVLADVEG